MNQTNNIEDLAKDLGIDSGTSSNSADRMRKIAESIGMENYNSLYDNDKLQERLRNLKHEKNPNIPHFNPQGSTPNVNNNKNFATNMAKNKLNNQRGNNSRMTNQLASKGLQSMGLPKPASDMVANSGLGNSLKRKNPILNALDKLNGGKRDTDVESQESATSGLNGTVSKAFKWGLIGAVGGLPIIMIFICIFVVSTQIYIKSVGIGHVDSLSDSDAESKIDKKTKNLDNSNINDEASLDIFIDDETLVFKKSKLDSQNLIEIASTKKRYKRKYNEARLEEIEDFYPAVKSMNTEADKRLAYDFFLKIFNIYHFYEDTYETNPKDKYPLIDLPLLMSTLMVQSEDINVVFASNLEDEDRKPDLRQQPVDDYRYDKDWSDYSLNKNESTHDIEILVQHMVSKQVRESCNDSNGKEVKFNILKDNEIDSQVLTCEEGQSYSKSGIYYSHDKKKYKEFLKEFIEKKYYIEDEMPDDELDDGKSKDRQTGPWSTWKQCDGAWGKIVVPKSKKTMCQIGCLITSVSIQIARSGTLTTVENFNPGVAVKKFSFASGGNYYWNSATNVAPNFRYLTSQSLVGLSKENVASKLKKYDSSKYYIILAVSNKNRNSVHHYIALDYVDKSTNKIYMYDPAKTNTNDVYSIYKVYAAHIYEKKD